MALGVRSTTRSPGLCLRSVSIWLYACAFLLFPQLAGQAWTESAEGERPCQEDRENSEEELVVWPSARRRLSEQRRCEFGRPHDTGHWLQRIASCSSRPTAVVGHQLANGLGAPLLI